VTSAAFKTAHILANNKKLFQDGGLIKKPSNLAMNLFLMAFQVNQR
jgi:hypothetical protein